MPYKDIEKRKANNRAYYKKRKDAGLCTRCGKPRERERGTNSWCLDCFNKDAKFYQRKYRKRKTELQHDRRQAIRKAVIQNYGGKCVCCGETEDKFLAIDHIIPCGEKGRESSNRLYRRLKRMNYPDSYRVLCHNCNFGRWLNGGKCPHESE